MHRYALAPLVVLVIAGQFSWAMDEKPNGTTLVAIGQMNCNLSQSGTRRDLEEESELDDTIIIDRERDDDPAANTDDTDVVLSDSEDDDELSTSVETRFFVVISDDSKSLTSQERYSSVVHTIRQLLSIQDTDGHNLKKFAARAPEKRDWRIHELSSVQFKGLESGNGDEVSRQIHARPQFLHGATVILQWCDTAPGSSFINNPQLMVRPNMRKPAVLLFVKSGPNTPCIFAQESPIKWASMQLTDADSLMTYDVLHQLVSVELIDVAN